MQFNWIQIKYKYDSINFNQFIKPTHGEHDNYHVEVIYVHIHTVCPHNNVIYIKKKKNKEWSEMTVGIILHDLLPDE